MLKTHVNRNLLFPDLAEIASFLGITSSVDTEAIQQLAKDMQLVDSIAEKQAQIFSEELKLFPADVQIQSVYPLPDISELERKLSEYSKKLSNLQQMVQDLASKTIQSIWLSHVAMQFLGNLRSVRDSYAAMSIGSLPTTEDPSSITKIILDCESALTFLNRSLSVLSTSVAREQEKAP
ncbi:hypothetical protein BHE74_00000672 [Ensete ventricosum]|nr:hypothetical protein GW17_00002419 [Ensete ventricosum]RWW90192.1 hypothetical protein BHE74_00000672 [Ensete ventricosum]RZR94723.1 hypothetical protein BHM03_00023470 [Ensete ventricosum]